MVWFGIFVYCCFLGAWCVCEREREREGEREGERGRERVMVVGVKVVTVFLIFTGRRGRREVVYWRDEIMCSIWNVCLGDTM
jgi:hypothetical protein